MLTPFYPFSWKWEESALQFYDLIPLGEISVAPGMSNAQGMENRKYALVLTLSVCVRLYVCVLQLQTPTHKNICLHTKIFVRGCSQPLSACPLLKKIAKLLYCCTCHLWASQLHCLPLPGISLPPGLNGPLCAEWVSRSEERAGFRLSAGCI